MKRLLKYVEKKVVKNIIQQKDGKVERMFMVMDSMFEKDDEYNKEYDTSGISWVEVVLMGAAVPLCVFMALLLGAYPLFMLPISIIMALFWVGLLASLK